MFKWKAAVNKLKKTAVYKNFKGKKKMKKNDLQKPQDGKRGLWKVTRNVP